jgi:hypothetical protein
MLRPDPLHPHTQFFELCAALLALADAICARARAGYLQFPQVMAALQQRLLAALDAAPASFAALLRRLRDDDRPFMLHHAQVRLDRALTPSTSPAAPASAAASAAASAQSPCPQCGLATGLCGFVCAADVGYFYDVFALHAVPVAPAVVARSDNSLGAWTAE